MIRTGLVSVTFRNLSPADIVALVAGAGLDAVEWGGDVHVPHGDLETATDVGRLTREAGLEVCSYGSYYRAFESPTEGLSFETVLRTADALGAPMVRVWAGRRGSAEADVEYRDRVVEDLRRIGAAAGNKGIGISIEYHGHSLTDTNESADRLIREVDHPNVWLYWQPRIGADEAECLAGLEAVRDRVSNLHVYYWDVRDEKHERYPLANGAAVWAKYLDAMRATGRDHYALIEFVADDSSEQFLRDAAALTEWLA